MFLAEGFFFGFFFVSFFLALPHSRMGRAYSILLRLCLVSVRDVGDVSGVTVENCGPIFFFSTGFWEKHSGSGDGEDFLKKCAMGFSMRKLSQSLLMEVPSSLNCCRNVFLSGEWGSNISRCSIGFILGVDCGNSPFKFLHKFWKWSMLKAWFILTEQCSLC